MSKHIFGLANVELSDIAVDGSIGTAFVPVGETVSGTAEMTTTDPTVNDITIEESDSPVESIVQPGISQIAWSTYNIDGAQLVKFFGGTYTPQSGVDPDIIPAKYTPPASVPDIEKSVKVTDKKGNVVTVTRAKISAKLGLSFKKDTLGKVDIVAKILDPTKAGEPRYTIEYAL